jgi:hypothetical protein
MEDYFFSLGGGGEMEDEFYVFVKLKTAWIELSR